MEKSDKFEEIFEKSPIGILFYDKEGKLIDANQSALKIERIPKFEDVKGISLFINPDIESRKKELLKNGIIRFQSSRELNKTKEYGFYTPTESGIIYIDYTVSITDSGFLMQIQDITESKKAEEELKEGEEKFSKVFHANPGAIAILKPEGSILEVNDEFINLTGYSKDEIIGNSSVDLNLVSAEFRKKLYKKMQENGPCHNLELEIQTKSGKERNVLNTVENIEIKGQKRILSIFYDITKRKKAEKTLRESEARFRSVLDNSLDALYRVNLKTNQYEYLSPAFEGVVGFSPKKFMSMTSEEAMSIVHPDDLSVAKEALARLEVEGHVTVDYRVLDRGGKYRWLSNHISLIRDDEGQPLYRDGTIRNITEQKKAEKELIEVLDNSQRLTEELEASNEQLKQQGVELLQVNKSLRQSDEDMNRAQEVGQIGSWRLDVRWNILTWSDENYRIFGVPKGTPMTYEMFLEIVHPDDRQYVDTQWNAGLAGEPYDIEHRIVVGTQIKWVREKAYLEFDDEGIVLGGFGITQDITDRKKLEEELRQAYGHLEEQINERTVELKEAYESLKESEERFDLAIKAAQEGIWDWNIETNAVWYSHRYKEMLGYSDNEIENHINAWLHLLHPDDKKRTLQLVDAILKGERDYEVEFRLRHKDGHYVDILSRGFPVRRELDGKIIRIVGTHVDLTELKKAEKQLKEAITELKHSNKELQQFAYISSHDLQEPLRTIASFTQLLQLRYKGKFDEDADEFMEYIVEAAIRMKEQIEGLLEYSRVGTKGGEFKTVDLNEILHQTIQNLHISIEESEAKIIADDLPNVMGDVEQLRRVFQNLISNAIKFRKSEEPPKIKISANKDIYNSEYVFSVKDNGIGIEEQYSERIFTIFQRLHTRKVYKGTGIGLSIVKRIIKRHGGRIWVESEFGVGSTFYFTIPIDQVAK
ncbi:PAS domain S-box protein [Methanobacterium oryzae]|uniref:PAS domain S-box protein n=1 Tax=Methanobacterium oryzae TaxID=69540 RepID=UPI003D1E38B9